MSSSWRWRLVAIDCPPESAASCADEVIAWLVAEGVVERSVAEAAGGYPPGPDVRRVLVDGDPESLLGRSPNGLEIETGRTVFDAGTAGFRLGCPACGHEFEPDEDWYEAVGPWHEGDDDASYACPSCAGEQRLVEWDGPEPWAFGHLGFSFQNWPPLTEAFVVDVEGRVPGRVRVVYADY